MQQVSEGVVLEQAGLADLGDIMSVMQAAFDPQHGEAWNEAQCAGILTLPGSSLVVARVEGRPAGFALVRSVLQEAELLLLAVSPDFQRRSIGAALLAATLKAARADGVERLFLEVRETNSAAQFYEKAGFTVIGKRPNYYRSLDGSRRDALTYAIQI